MSELAKRAQAAAVLYGGLRTVRGNAPGQYADRQRQYFQQETRRFQRLTAPLASDFYRARVQGLFGGPEEWTECGIRLANVVRPSSSIQRNFDDYKQYLFASERVTYVQPGTKIETMGSVWLVANADNISGAHATGLCRRCNATWRFLDYYGNVVSEPIIKENLRANASDSDAQSSLLVTKGYFNIICQYNKFTRQISTNTRMILGNGAYRVTGLSELDAEFTDDDDSVRFLGFAVRYEEPNPEIDDMERRVAGGKTFRWDISVHGRRALRVGETARLLAESERTGEPVLGAGCVGRTFFAPRSWRDGGNTILAGPETTLEGGKLLVRAVPVTYLWSSEDETVATVDEYGCVTAQSEGEAVITARLAQNPEISERVTVTVEAAANGVFFTSPVPESLQALDTLHLEAAWYSSGEKTGEALLWEFSGTDKSVWTAEVDQDGRGVTLRSYGYSETPLTVTARYGEYTASAALRLEGI